MALADEKPCRAGARSACGFTLIELLVVIAIIALLVSILMPSLQKAKVLAGVAACGVQMKTLNVAILAYTNEYNEKLPYMDNPGNQGAAETIAVDIVDGLPKWSGFGTLRGGRYVEDYRTFYCPGTIVRPGTGWGGDDARKVCMDRFEEWFKAGYDNRVDYVLGWGFGCPRDTSKNPAVPATTISAFRKVWRFWLADGCTCFAIYYQSGFHAGEKYCNVGKVDGSVVSVVDYKRKEKTDDAIGMANANNYYPYNDRAYNGFWVQLGPLNNP